MASYSAYNSNAPETPFLLATSPHVHEVSLEFAESEEDVKRLVALATVVRARIPHLTDAIAAVGTLVDELQEDIKRVGGAFARLRGMDGVPDDRAEAFDASLDTYMRVSRDLLGRHEEKRDSLCRELAFLGSIVASFREALHASDANDGSSAQTGALGECFACMNNAVTEAFVPCGHTICGKCSDKLVSDYCPMCRAQADRRMRLFLNSV